MRVNSRRSTSILDEISRIIKHDDLTEWLMQVEDYSSEMPEMEGVSREEYLASLRRRSSGFSRGVSKYRGVARCLLPSINLLHYTNLDLNTYIVTWSPIVSLNPLTSHYSPHPIKNIIIASQEIEHYELWPSIYKKILFMLRNKYH